MEVHKRGDGLRGYVVDEITRMRAANWEVSIIKTHDERPTSKEEQRPAKRGSRRGQNHIERAHAEGSSESLSFLPLRSNYATNLQS